ncbi:MAG: hypothetical protein OJF55_002099 [Rhodanobacteraceae bacterium]|nr:MAG: hypothetical protein OJF55_002099 [Rhodanobacteraceae bacterium]
MNRVIIRQVSSRWRSRVREPGSHAALRPSPGFFALPLYRPGRSA